MQQIPAEILSFTNSDASLAPEISVKEASDKKKLSKILSDVPVYILNDPFSILITKRKIYFKIVLFQL